MIVHNAAYPHPMLDIVHGVRKLTGNPKWLPPTPHTRRLYEVERQRHEEKRTGGGPLCPLCKQRNMRYLQPGLIFCQTESCRTAWYVYILKGELKVSKVPRDVAARQ